MVAAALGYRTHFVFSDAFSDEKRWTMKAYGAEITDITSDDKQITRELIRAMIARAGEISQQPNHWWSDQLNNEDGADAYLGLGDEIWAADRRQSRCLRPYDQHRAFHPWYKSSTAPTQAGTAGLWG